MVVGIAGSCSAWPLIVFAIASVTHQHPPLPSLEKGPGERESPGRYIDCASGSARQRRVPPSGDGSGRR
ncbi:MAG: hypothetical protein KDI64_12465, partial [Candidatus Accumulibacter sp.]|nr:hypothetical protein [Accumulibacter sp.]